MWPADLNDMQCCLLFLCGTFQLRKKNIFHCRRLQQTTFYTLCFLMQNSDFSVSGRQRSFNPLEFRGNYSATSNRPNMKLVTGR